MERTDDIRATLAQEITRKEDELTHLRQTLKSLDSALAAAAEAHARSAAAHSLYAASQIAADARRAETLVAPVLPPEPLPAPAIAAEPAPVVLQKEIEPAKPLAPLLPPVAEQVQPQRTAAPPGKYVNLKVWKAVQTLLFERAEKMSIEEIARELKAGGASLGDSPVRTVATAVGYMNTKIFHVTKSGGKTLVDLIARN
ncbi:hypothetical protein [Terriglobus saanensis]|uniref:Uncharacterized protein n=1 Tax=Terriglobus saanensis (strain ATCC BAA-1853 / DSM 23119 / SP1PR4) TaxID=401053 RepID=E8UY38_TERSS|nr:hypothetical protein [Terriglobus saanensis]ADV80848.1 hypothetical protein AciPR4_0006 [Terriglobus saanensis SP1PR4]